MKDFAGLFQIMYCLLQKSGIKTNEDIRRLKEAKVNGVLIGETLMRAKNKKEILDELAK